MKLKLLCVALVFATTPALAAMGTTDIPTFAGQAAAKETAKSAVPRTPEEWLARMSDFSRNLSAFKDPKMFVPWANAVTEPSFYVAMMNGMMDPGGWLNMMNTAAHPDAVRNLTQFTDPNILLKWAAASADPNFYTAMLTQLSDPGKAMRWAMLPIDSKMWNTLLSTLNPNTYIRWGLSGLDPRAWNLAGTLANPALYTGMLGAIVNPNAYGQGTSSWLNWTPQPSVQGAGSFSMWDPVAMLGNLSGFIPGINLSGLQKLPNIGLPTISLPSFPVAAPAMNASPVYPNAVPDTRPAAEAPAVETEAEAAASPEPAAAPAEAPTPALTLDTTLAAPVEVVPAPTPAPAPVTAVPAPAAAIPAPQVVAPVPAEPAPVAAAPVVVAPAPAIPAPVVVIPAPVAAVPAPAIPAPVVVIQAPVTAVPLPAVAAPAPVVSSKMVLSGDALFNLGKSGIKDLSKEGKKRLDEVVAKLKAMPGVDQIKVIGHADPTGKTQDNQALSEARAKSIRSYLVAKGIKPGVISTGGMGDTQPVVQCDKTLAKPALIECHAPNRRVEIEVIGKAR